MIHVNASFTAFLIAFFLTCSARANGKREAESQKEKTSADAAGRAIMARR